VLEPTAAQRASRGGGALVAARLGGRSTGTLVPDRWTVLRMEA
jgi:hypothetical protein